MSNKLAKEALTKKIIGRTSTTKAVYKRRFSPTHLYSLESHPQSRKYNQELTQRVLWNQHTSGKIIMVENRFCQEEEEETYERLSNQFELLYRISFDRLGEEKPKLLR